MFQLSTKPQSIGKVLDESIRLFFASFSKVFLFTLIFSFIVFSPHFFLADFMPAPGEEPDLDFFWKILPASIGVGILAAAFYIGMFYRMDKIAKGQDATFGASVAVGLKKLIPLIVAGILFVLSFIAGSILLIIPGIILMLSLYFYMPLITCDNLGPVKALLTSHRLVWGNWWRTATVFMVPFFIIIALGILMGIIVAAVIGMGVASGETAEESATAGMMISNIIMMLFYMIVYPYLAAVTLVQLNDLKLRKQGSDLEARVAAG